MMVAFSIVCFALLFTAINGETVKTWRAATTEEEVTSSSSSSTSSHIKHTEVLRKVFLATGDPSDNDVHPLMTFALKYNDMMETQALESSSGENSASDFPEFESLPRYNLTDTKSNSAIAFSGGGSRAFLCAAGYVAGLRKVGLLAKARYMAGISGGNWFVNSYIYRGFKQNEDVEAYLGEVVAPEECTMDKLDDMDKLCIRSFARKPCILDILGAYLEGIAPFVAWTRGIYETYLEGAGVKQNAPVAWDLEDAAAFVERNPSAGYVVEDFNVVADPINDPFPLVGFVNVGPNEQAPFAPFKSTLTMIESTPIATGVSNFQTVSYKSRDRDKGTAEMKVGGFIETAAFGSELLKDNGDGTAQVDMSSSGSWSVELSAAASSMAPEEFFSLTTARVADYLGFHANYFAPEGGGEVFNADVLLADGGDMENVSLIPFLLRGVKKIVLFCDFEVPMASFDHYNPWTRLPTPQDIEDIPHYFGIPQVPQNVEDWFDFFGQDFSRNKVFKTIYYPHVVRELQKAQATGNGAIATLKLTTVDNDWWGVKGGQEVEVTFVYLSKSTEFENLLPDEVKDVVATGTDDPTDLIQDGPFKYFPHYNTGAAEISYKQANLLSNFCAWIIEKNLDIFKNALG